MNRILLIDDDTGAQLLYRNRLTDLGYEVVVSSTGAKGLMEARSAPFDLFLVDIGLGSGIDGFEVCRRLRTIPEIHGVPVVLISSHVKTQEDLHLGYEAGCQAFLVKGDLTLLEDVVRAMLRIKLLQNDLALQNRLLEEHNRRLEAEKARSADLEEALAKDGSRTARLPLRADGVLLVDEEGVVRRCDRGARDLFGQAIEGKHLARLAPESRLEAIVRNSHSEPQESIRFEVPDRVGRAARTLSASVFPFAPSTDPAERALRLVLLHDTVRQRGSGEVVRSEGSPNRGQEWGALVEAARALFRPSALLGTSAVAQALRERVVRAASGENPVLVQGPSGSGKEFVARILHYSGGRPGPFVTVACGAFGARELEHELFGSAKGRAPEAPERLGALQLAHGGTLFLRDVERLPMPLQVRLLEVLLHGRLPRPGGTSERIDVRLVAGTRTDLAHALERGQFERELARRLANDTLRLTALRERREDIAPLAKAFQARHAHFEGASFASEALWVLEQHDWPENVRELELTVQGACVAARAAELGLGDLPQALNDLARSLGERGQKPHSGVKKGAAGLEHEIDTLLASLGSAVSLLDAYEKGALLHSLRLTNGDKLAAARLLKVGKSTFYRKLKQYGI